MSYLDYKMCCLVAVGELKTDLVASLRVDKNLNELGAKATIVIPKRHTKLNIQGQEDTLEQKDVSKLVKVGDTVKIELGYNDILNSDFEGYVTKVGADTPLVIECEDGLYLTKKEKVNKSWKGAALSKILSDVMPSALPHKVTQDVTLGDVVAQNTTVYKLLEQLKTLGIHSVMNKGVLKVGFTAGRQIDLVSVFDPNKNVVNSSGLKYKKAEDLKVLVKAISLNKDGTKTTVEVGEESGIVRTFHKSNMSETDLKAIAEEQLNKLSFDGLEGSFTAFGFPYTQTGQAVEWRDTKHPERSGFYLVEKTVATYNKSGYRREITLKNKLK